MDLLSFAALACVALLAATVQAATGFGFAIMAVPFFLFIMGSLTAIQVTVVINFVISLVLLPRLWKDAPRRLLAHLITGSIAGYPLGLMLYKAADLNSVKLIVGVLITLFALILIAREFKRGENTPENSGGSQDFIPRPVPEIALGVVSGVMAVALAMPGPVVVLYLLARSAGKQVSRPTTLLLFGVSYGVASLVHAIWGGMTAETWAIAVKLIPFVIAGAVVGHFATRFLSEQVFRAIILTVLVASGLYGIWSAV